MDEQVLDLKIDGLVTAIGKLELRLEKYMQSTESRIRALEDWRLAFVTKLTAYCAIALFAGTIISQIGIHLISVYLTK